MDTDKILKEVGHFGKYQVSIFLLLLLAGVYTTFYSISYVFTAGDIDYRCLIEECDGHNIPSNYWLHHAVPFKGTKPDKCLRYQVNNSTDLLTADHSDTCREEIFFKNITERCHSFYYYTNETTIVNDFDLYCAGNNWKRAAVGTANNIGQFIGMPLGGIVSDRFGRKNMLTASILLSAISGICRSYAPTYETFMLFEVIDAIVASGSYSACFIIGIEILGSGQRVLGSVIIASFYTLGEVITGIVAWALENWRLSLRALYAPGIIFVFYIWLLPESIRWLIANRKYVQAKEIVERMATINKVTLSQELKKQLENIVETKDKSSKKPERRPSIVEKHKGVFKEVITSNVMVLRTAVCSFSWMTNAFVFYGLSLNSVGVAGNKYGNFLLVCLAELPGYLITWIILDRFGRKLSLFSALAISGLFCIGFYFLPEGLVTAKLVLYLVGKCAITVSFSVLYIFSSEIFPTNARHSLMGTCSMFGRIGSMLAPLTPLMATYIEPTLIFGMAALTAGFLGLQFPETLNQKLPDTIREAEIIGKTEKSKENVA